MAMATTEMVEVALDRIIPNPWQPRVNAVQEHVENLAKDIEAVGLLQEPMARMDGICYQLAFGHCRIDALRLLQEQGKWGATVRLKVQQLTDDEMAYIALSENSARQDITPAEQIRAWAKAITEIPGITIQSLADKVGIDRTTMSKNLAILDLPDGVLNLVDSGAMSVRSAREFLVLRNDHHCHDDQIAIVLEDLDGGLSGYNISEGKPPDYRLKTVRRAIRGLALGRPGYGQPKGIYENDRKWRPLDNNNRSGRSVSFDVKAFKEQYPHSVHVLPEGEESGGSEWTCEVKAWSSWSSRASREATMAAKQSGQPTPAQQRESGGRKDLAAEWWKVVKRDPVVEEVVGKRLKAMKSAADLTDEDRKALGSRVEFPNLNNAIELPSLAQPEGVEFRFDRDNAQKPPLFDFSLCASCVTGAAWAPGEYSHPKGRLMCINKQAWEDKKSVGMQKWVAVKVEQMSNDLIADQEAVGRLSLLADGDARALFYSMFDWLLQGHRVRPLESINDWSERTRHDYWPAGAEMFASLTGLTFPDPSGWNYNQQEAWERAIKSWIQKIPKDLDWPLALGCLLAWRARVAQGLGVNIWEDVATATVASD